MPARGRSLHGLQFTKTALDSLRSIRDGKLRRRIREQIEALVATPRPRGTRKLRGVSLDGAPVYRQRTGDYRIIYVVKDNPKAITVLTIGHRKDVYRGR